MTARSPRRRPDVRLLVASVAAALLVGITTSRAQPAAPAPQGSAAPPAAVPVPTAPTEGLGDLNAVTFSCAKAGLNAAAREAAKASSQGTYQFSFFRIVSDTHHSTYEVHFKSNYEGEKDLKYCVAIYCQQGWDPKDTQPMVTLMRDERRSARSQTARTAGAADCGRHWHSPAKRVYNETGEKPADRN
jgi:hypothetical protein